MLAGFFIGVLGMKCCRGTRFLCASLMVTFSSCCSEVLIITHSYNRPDFIEWQRKTFNKFLLDNYRFIVFNDASDGVMSNQIETVCAKNDIECIRVPQNHPDNTPGSRHQDGIQFSLQAVGFNHDGIVCMIDSDMFIVKPFSISKFMEEVDIAALPQSRPNGVAYLFPGLVFMNMRTLTNKETMSWRGGYVNGSATDTGGQMHYYLKNNPGLRVHFMNQMLFGRQANDIENSAFICDSCKAHNILACTHNTEILRLCHLDDKAINFLQKGPQGGNEFMLDAHFFHYRCGTWDFSIDHNLKTVLVNEYFDSLMAE